MSKKEGKKKKGLIVLSKETVELAMKKHEEEMMKDPEGARILKEDKEALERAMKEGE